jgi:MPBQ/MSBQ methyltransferase
MPDLPQAVAAHYGRADLGRAILGALQAAGKDIDRLSLDDLAPIDEFHTGQRDATVRLAQLAQIKGGETLLDVGCGIGGPSRYLAKTFGCRVTGLDLTAEFIDVATMLSQLTGLAGQVTYRQGDTLHLPFADGSFDLVWSQNAAMNIADRDRLYGETRRVLKPTGRLAISGRCGRFGRRAGLSGALGEDQRHQLFVYPGRNPAKLTARRLQRRHLA